MVNGTLIVNTAMQLRFATPASDGPIDRDAEIALPRDWSQTLIGEIEGRPIRGHGTAMMRLALALCFAPPEVAAALVDPLVANTGAHRFYRRLGFRPVGRRTFGEDGCLVHRLERGDWAARTRPPMVR